MTSIYKCDEKTIRPGQQFVDADGNTHPGSWYTYSAERKVELGITEIVQQSHPDSRLYNWGYNGVQVVTKGVKSNLKGEVKAQQSSLLAQTDWAVIRNADTGDAIPANIATYRAAIRTKATDMETAITAAADTDAVAALFLTYTAEDDGSTTKSGVLFDWPELG